jgi:enolase-phosphatase E1
VPIGIYSSGSVLAQQCLFRTTPAGDLTPFIKWWFDTGVGGKREAASYARIAEQMGLAPAAVAFVSDIVAELDAARAAGMRTLLSMRPGNAPQPTSDHTAVATFDEIV